MNQQIHKMENILNDFNSLLKNAEQLKKSIEQRFIQTGKDIDKIEDEEIKIYLKNSLSLAKENKLDISDFIKNIEKKCQQK